MAFDLAESTRVYLNAALAIWAFAVVHVVRCSAQGLVVWVEVALYQQN